MIKMYETVVQNGRDFFPALYSSGMHSMNVKAGG